MNLFGECSGSRATRAHVHLCSNVQAQKKIERDGEDDGDDGTDFDSIFGAVACELKRVQIRGR